jgi:hypothetical protein
MKQIELDRLKRNKEIDKLNEDIITKDIKLY